MAHEFSHLTAQQAAELAVKANVKQLILTHISRRYREKDVQKEAQQSTRTSRWHAISIRSRSSATNEAVRERLECESGRKRATGFTNRL